MNFFHFIAGSYYKPRLRQHLHLYHHLRSTHRFPPSSPTTPKCKPNPPIPIPPMTTVPNLAHRCNLLSPDATCRTTSTLGSLSAFFGVMQPGNRMSPTPFSEIRDLFRNNPRSETSRAITVKETEEPEKGMVSKGKDKLK